APGRGAWYSPFPCRRTMPRTCSPVAPSCPWRLNMHPLWVTFLVFGLSLLACHAPICWVWWGQKGVVRSKDRWIRAWEKTDYLSLGLASLALISAANEVKRTFSGLQLKWRLPFIGY